MDGAGVFSNKFFDPQIYYMEIINGPLNWILYQDHVALINSKAHAPLVSAVHQQFQDISTNFSAYEHLLTPYVEIRKVEKITVYALQSDGDRLFLGIFYVLYHLIVYNQQFLNNLANFINNLA